MSERVYLNVPKEEKDIAKGLGARWDGELYRWYCFDFNQDDFERWMPFSTMSYKDLSEEQKLSIDIAQTGANVLVDACIGSGKTTTIQVMCNELKDKNILYLTYNRLLKKDAQMKIISPNTEATNYDGFAYSCLRKAGLPTDYERNIRLFNQHKPNTKAYDVLILDEYQDIKEDISIMLQILKERNPKMQIISVGDMHQKIYNFTSLNIRQFMPSFLGEYESVNFTKCFRLNKEHAEKLGMLWGKKINGVNDKNKTIVMDDLDDIIQFLLDKDPKDILVLGARTGDAVKLLNALENTYPEKFNKNTVYASIRDEDRGNLDQNNVAIFTTFDSAKGLERKYCIIMDWTLEYFVVRAKQPNADFETLRNVFLVAASRGKDVNLFYEKRPGALVSDIHYNNEIMSSYYANQKEILLTPFEHKYAHPTVFTASNMYDFLYAEDVAKCSFLIETKKINNGVCSTIDVNSKDGTIDLSYCIGTFVEANFFEKYDIFNDMEMLLLQDNIDFIKSLKKKNEAVFDGTKEVVSWSSIRFENPKATLEERILMLAGTETMQDRYCWQVDTPYVKTDASEMIKERLKTVFDGSEDVQKTCEIDFSCLNRTTGVKEDYEIHGRIDVEKNNTIYELKFAEELQETYFLQLAFYLCANPDKRGILWNVKTNDMYEVSVPDKEAFLKQTVFAIGKRNLRAEEFSTYKSGETKLDFHEQGYRYDNSKPGKKLRAKKKKMFE